MIRKLVRFFVHSLRILRIDSFQRFFWGFFGRKIIMMNSPGWLPQVCFEYKSQVFGFFHLFLSKFFFILCCFCGKNGAQKSLGSDPWRVTQLPGTDPWSISKDFRSLWIMAFTFLGPMVHVRSTWKAKAMPITWKTKRLWSMCTVGRHTFWIFWWVFFWTFGHVLKNNSRKFPQHVAV